MPTPDSVESSQPDIPESETGTEFEQAGESISDMEPEESSASESESETD
jgi:hypothetical protein